MVKKFRHLFGQRMPPQLFNAVSDSSPTGGTWPQVPPECSPTKQVSWHLYQPSAVPSAAQVTTAVCSRQRFFFTGDSRAASVVLSPHAIYGPLSFCRHLLISAFSNSFCVVRHLWPKKVEFAIIQQKMAFLSHITPHSRYLYHKSSLKIFSLKLRARAINSR